MGVDRISHLAEHARQRSADARRRVRDAIRELDHAGEAITFAAVAKKASVSRAWLYRASELRTEIERVREHRRRLPTSLPTAQRASIESYQRRMEALLDANRALREENRRLNERLATLLGERRDVRRGHVTDEKPVTPQAPRRPRSR